MLRDLRERHIVVEPADVADLDEKQQRRRRILEPCHYRLRREFDQCSELDQAEQRLEHTAEHHHGEGNRKNEWSAAGGDGLRIGMNKTVDQDAEEEGTVDPRGVDGRGPVAERDADDRNNERGRETRQCAIGKIILAQSGQREHAVAHGEGNCDRGRYQAAKNIIACLRCRLHGDFRLLATNHAPGTRRRHMHRVKLPDSRPLDCGNTQAVGNVRLRTVFRKR